MNGLRLPVNFRDLAGTPCAGGKTVKQKRLLRSGQLVGLSLEDRRILLEEYDLRCVIDLRADFERSEAPDVEMPGVRYHGIDLMQGQGMKTPGAKMLASLATPKMVEGFMKRSYKGMLTGAGARAGYAQMLDVLLQLEEGAALIHCFAGKDRSGLGVAIVLAALGASHEVIMEDYLKSNEAGEAIGAALAGGKQYGGFGGSPEAVGAAVKVKEEYLFEGLKAAAKECGTLEAFAREVLGLTNEKRDRLRELYLQ